MTSMKSTSDLLEEAASVLEAAGYRADLAADLRSRAVELTTIPPVDRKVSYRQEIRPIDVVTASCLVSSVTPPREPFALNRLNAAHVALKEARDLIAEDG